MWNRVLVWGAGCRLCGAGCRVWGVELKANRQEAADCLQLRVVRGPSIPDAVRVGCEVLGPDPQSCPHMCATSSSHCPEAPGCTLSPIGQDPGHWTGTCQVSADRGSMMVGLRAGGPNMLSCSDASSNCLGLCESALCLLSRLPAALQQSRC